MTIFPRAAGELRVCSFGSRDFFLFVSSRRFRESSQYLVFSPRARQRELTSTSLNSWMSHLLVELGDRETISGSYFSSKSETGVEFRSARTARTTRVERSKGVSDGGSSQNFNNCGLFRPPQALWRPVPWSPGQGHRATLQADRTTTSTSDFAFLRPPPPLALKTDASRPAWF